MNTFLVVAAVMAAIAAGAVALPLLRDRHSRLLGALVSVLVIGASAALYPLWSNWNWHAPAQTESAPGPDVGAMVAKLEKHMQDQPGDLPGWLMLGRSYLTLNRLDDAVLAFDHAHRLDAKNVDGAMGLGEAMSLRAGGDITPQAAQLFEEALASAPANPKALLYGGFAAAVRGDRPLARARWQALKDLNPPPQIMQMLDARIAELSPATGSPAAGDMAGAAPAGTSAAPAGTSTSPGGLSGAEVAVNISIAPALKSRLVSEAPLFVFATRARQSRATARGQASDEQRPRDASSSVAGRFHGAGTRSRQGPAGVHHGARILQRTTHSVDRGLVRRTLL